MNVFDLRDRVIGDYAAYVRSFLRINDAEIRKFVDGELARGRLWPDPLVQLNPSFEPGDTIEDLVRQGALHRECARIFRRDKTPDGGGITLRLHRHQQDALEVARTGRSYVLTTGTGSGKSLAYFVPIVDDVLRRGSRRGIKAIVVYPMNALCNSQLKELEKYLTFGYGPGQEPVTYARYTGQESEAERARIADSPPDILLTNYVMLELLMTRVDRHDRRVIQAAEGLEFLVLDELHTFRGRQGADVAMLVRRVRERLGSPAMRCIGTSATIAGRGSREARHAEVAALASRLFGTEVAPDAVIGETLRPVIERDPPSPAELRAALARPPSYPADYATLVRDPVAAWAETGFGIQRDAQGRLERKPPVTISQAAEALAQEAQAPIEDCRRHLQAVLLAGYQAQHPETGQRLFAFRLHQFVSRGDTVYSSLEPPGTRYLTMEGQIFVPGSRDRRLYKLAFCRECGQPYFVVDLVENTTLEPRALSDIATADRDERRSGFLFPDPHESWTPDVEGLPEDWLEPTRDGEWRIKSSHRRYLPERKYVSPDGTVSEIGGGDALPFWFVPAPFRFCLHCGVTYATPQGDFAKLAELATEGRSTATTVLSLAIVRGLRESKSEEVTPKLLSFTDNRQEASLQAGHFNDFVQVSLLRGALYRAVADAGPEGLCHDKIARKVVEALDLPFEEYASNPDASFASQRRIKEALQDVIGYRIYRDLRRGWRVNAPNLEQTGLLRIRYQDLEELCAAEEVWRDRHWVLAKASPEERAQACQVVLDYFRRELAIKVRYLDPDQLESIKQNSYQRLREPWAIEEDEELESAPMVRVGVRRPRSRYHEISISATSSLGKFLRRRSTWPSSLPQMLSRDEFEPLANDLFAILAIGGLLEPIHGQPNDQPLYQLQADVIRWTAGDGTPPAPDPLRIARGTSADAQTNEFFKELYRTIASSLRGIEAREHTAQVPSREREQREELFREGKLDVLYCSPTMELGVDIADLNAVNMRNVPPTPANYAQRSGRAGRSGQPALVLTYCSSLSPHDQYFFRRQHLMVAGSVTPPRIELANEDLIRSHVHAVWLAETGQWLGRSLKDVLDLSKKDEGLPLQDSVAHSLRNPHARQRAKERCQRLLSALESDLESAAWYRPDWLDWVIDQAPRSFDEACNRWRHLYLSAWRQREIQHAIAGDASASPQQKRQAERLRQEAETQLQLLTDEVTDVDSDFYSYRYFASEGFLPGYNFPRLPLSAYLPGRRQRRDRDEFVSRARFVAISEFGPRNIIYYEGSRYRIDKVILPLADEKDGSRTTTAKFCGACGYGHIGEAATDERCRHCNALLDGSALFLSNLFRMQNVSTRRVDRITSDEEERLRLGYDLMTSFQFAETRDGLVRTPADYTIGAEVVARAAYAPTATLWRINLGWRRRKDRSSFGFFLDMEKGVWAREESEPNGRDSQAENGTVPVDTPAMERVVPYVEDRRNALLFTPTPEFLQWGLRQAQLRLGVEPSPSSLLTSLQYALKRGIEVRYQVEDNEIAVELLPSGSEPTSILIYEAAEGGAGVLSRLVNEPHALAEVARVALEVCHFDPVTGEDRRRAVEATEDCEAACYNCLLGYTNQRDHRLLDRQAIQPLLLRLTEVTASTGSGFLSREQLRDELLAQCSSELERRFIQFLYDGGYRLPDRAQPLLKEYGTRPDFFYSEAMAWVYVDGPVHQYPERAQRDAEITARLKRDGEAVIRAGGEETWPATVAAYPWVFGPGER